MTEASPELERFIDEGIRLSKAKGYHPNTFISMRARWRTKEAIRRLVSAGDIQTGFRRMIPLGLKDWTLEAAVVRFPQEFDKEEREAAEWRLKQATHANA